jgi:FkbM family methyltransferase
MPTDSKDIISSLARACLSRIYRPGQVYRIPFGPLRGLSLEYHPSVTYHAVLGLRDLRMLQKLGRALGASGALPKDCTVLDIGANIGLYSLWFAKRVVPGGRVYAFEPGPTARAMLEANMALNMVTNVEIVPAACCLHSGPTEFYLAQNHHCSSRDADSAGGGRSFEKITVEGVSLDDFRDSLPKREHLSLIKMDIEGGGVDAIPGGRVVFEKDRPLCIIESHTPAEDRAIAKMLLDCDYCAYRLTNEEWVRRLDRTHPDPDGVWGTIFAVPRHMEREFRLLLQ